MIDPSRLLGRGIAFPPAIATDGRWAWSGAEANVREAIHIILLTELGSRTMLPQFGAGLGELLFEPNTVATRHLISDRVTHALAAWEPRISVQSVTVDADPRDPQAATVTIVYKLVASQAVERVSLGVTFAN